MVRYKAIYKEKKELYLKFEKAPEVLEYQTKITIKDKGKNPIKIELDFIGIEPLVAPMPPKQYKISSESISDVFPAINRWAKKYGYRIY